jgi:hypothetical protein
MVVSSKHDQVSIGSVGVNLKSVFLCNKVWGKKMPTECKYCGETIEPIFKIDEGIDCHVCPLCGRVIDACTDNIQVIGRDM